MIVVAQFKESYFSRILAASTHSVTRRLYPGLVVKACFSPENASNILYVVFLLSDFWLLCIFGASINA